MKKFFLLCVTVLLITHVSFAKIWRVNNNAGVIADFTTAQAANDNASVLAGDTIHLEPSITSYGGLNCNKRLTWISTGAFLNIYPNEQFSPNVGKLDNISAYQTGCESSVFHVYVNGSISLGATGLRVDRCFLGGSIDISNYLGPVFTNIVVINSYSRGSLSVNAHSNNVITNNIFESSLNASSGTTLAVITHNVFNAVNDGAGTVTNAIVENNIFNKVTTAYTFTNSTAQYNMSGSAGVLPAGNNNQNSVDMSTVFVNNSGNTDAAFVLKAGSPAIGAGSSGVDLGAFGGGSPFKLAMQPAIPAIYKIQAPAAPSGNTLNVTFSTKSNN
jgi:hypothetical protein